MSTGEANAIIGGVMVLALAIALLLALKRFVGGVDSGIFIALLLVPIAVYSLLSGKIQEMSGGGLWIKFRDFAQASVATSGIKNGIMDEAQALAARLEKGGSGHPQTMGAQTQNGPAGSAQAFCWEVRLL